MIRNPVVSGRFYTSNPNKLEKEIQGYIKAGSSKYDALGCVSPHAGYIFSGQVAGEVLSAMNRSDSYIILGPNHTGMGKQFGLDIERQWLTPLGEVNTDTELAKAILDTSDLVEKDQHCHDYEHSIEVQLPFLQVLNGGFRFVPIVVGAGSRDEYKKLGNDIARAIREIKRHVVIIASSDMTHYEGHETAKKKDRLAIDRVLRLDVDGLLNEIQTYDISMCGYAPTAAMISACKELGAKRAELIKYQTSGDVSGDYSTVVGYAGIVVY